MFTEIFVCQNCDGTTELQWIEVSDIHKHPAVHRTATHSKEIPNPKCHSTKVKKPSSSERESWCLYNYMRQSSSGHHHWKINVRHKPLLC